ALRCGIPGGASAVRVLLATDGSKDAQAAAAYLREFPLPDTARILVLTVVTPAPSPLDIPPVREFNDALLVAGRRIVDEARLLLGTRGTGAEPRVVQDGPKEQIVRVAEEWQADLVVVGASGLGGVRGFLLGSVSQTVASHTHCAVLVVKGRARRFGSALIATDGSVVRHAPCRVLTVPPALGAASVAGAVAEA